MNYASYTDEIKIITNNIKKCLQYAYPSVFSHFNFIDDPKVYELFYLAMLCDYIINKSNSILNKKFSYELIDSIKIYSDLSYVPTLVLDKLLIISNKNTSKKYDLRKLAVLFDNEHLDNENVQKRLNNKVAFKKRNQLFSTIQEYENNEHKELQFINKLNINYDKNKIFVPLNMVDYYAFFFFKSSNCLPHQFVHDLSFETNSKNENIDSTIKSIKSNFVKVSDNFLDIDNYLNDISKSSMISNIDDITNIYYRNIFGKIQLLKKLETGLLIENLYSKQFVPNKYSYSNLLLFLDSILLNSYSFTNDNYFSVLEEISRIFDSNLYVTNFLATTLIYIFKDLLSASENKQFDLNASTTFVKAYSALFNNEHSFENIKFDYIDLNNHFKNIVQVEKEATDVSLFDDYICALNTIQPISYDTNEYPSYLKLIESLLNSLFITPISSFAVKHRSNNEVIKKRSSELLYRFIKPHSPVRRLDNYDLIFDYFKKNKENKHKK